MRLASLEVGPRVLGALTATRTSCSWHGAAAWLEPASRRTNRSDTTTDTRRARLGNLKAVLRRSQPRVAHDRGSGHPSVQPNARGRSEPTTLRRKEALKDPATDAE